MIPKHKQLSTHQLLDPKRSKFQSTGSFHLKFKGGVRPIHHNPYESFPTTVLVKQSNDDSNYLNGEGSDILTQMQEQQSENTELTKSKQQLFSAEFTSPKQGVTRLPTRSRNYLIEKSSTDINIQRLVE